MAYVLLCKAHKHERSGWHGGRGGGGAAHSHFICKQMMSGRSILSGTQEHRKHACSAKQACTALKKRGGGGGGSPAVANIW